MKNILTIFGKEFTVFLRDKRTLITTFVLPIVFYYIFFNVMAGMALKTKKEIKNKTVKVGYSTNLPSKMLAYLKSSLENLSFEQIAGENVEKLLGISRNLNNMSGIDAVYLWHNYCSKGCKESLKILLEYNKEDVLNLIRLRRKLNVS